MQSTLQTDALIGFVEIEELDTNGNIIAKSTHNLVVMSARTIIRDLITQPDESLKVSLLELGDMNMTFGDDVSNLPKPTITDTSLVHAVYSTTRTLEPLKYTYQGRPAVKMFFTVPADQANDPNPAVATKLFTELGLFTPSGVMYSRATLPILKTRGAGLNINWILVI